MALSADKALQYQEGKQHSLPIDGGATYAIFKGGALAYDTSGYIRPGANTAGFRFAGFALENVTTTATSSDGAHTVLAAQQGVAVLTISGVAVTDVGRPVWLSDDTTGTLTATNVGPIGTVFEYLSSNTALVRFSAVGGGGAFLSVDYGTGAVASNSTTKEVSTGLTAVTAAMVTNQAIAPTKVFGSDNTISSAAVTVGRESSGTAEVNFNYLFVGY